MRVLVDTSVWSRAFRARSGPPDPSAERLEQVIRKSDVVLTGLILQEVLQGFRSDAVFRRVGRHLEPFALLQLDRADYVAAADLRRSCATTGIVVSTADCQIAAAAIRHRCALFTLDRDFDLIARQAPLRLLA